MDKLLAHRLSHMHLLSGKVFQADVSVEQQSSIGTLFCQRCTPTYAGERISLQKGRCERIKKGIAGIANPSLGKNKKKLCWKEKLGADRIYGASHKGPKKHHSFICINSWLSRKEEKSNNVVKIERMHGTSVLRYWRDRRNSLMASQSFFFRNTSQPSYLLLR